MVQLPRFWQGYEEGCVSTESLDVFIVVFALQIIERLVKTIYTQAHVPWSIKTPQVIVKKGKTVNWPQNWVNTAGRFVISHHIIKKAEILLCVAHHMACSQSKVHSNNPSHRQM